MRPALDRAYSAARLRSFHYRWRWSLRGLVVEHRDVVASDAVLTDPEVADLLGGNLEAEPVEAAPKGLEGEHLRLGCVRERAAASHDEEGAASSVA